MGRWTQYDEDEYRLPEGMKRIGYDADSGRYYFRDSTDRSIWQGPIGAEFGELKKVKALPSSLVSEGTSNSHPDSEDDLDDLDDGLTTDDDRRGGDVEASPRARSGGYRSLSHGHLTRPVIQRSAQDMDTSTNPYRTLFPFFLIIAVVLLLVWRLLVSPGLSAPTMKKCPEGTASHWIQPGDSCWEVARAHGWTMDKFREANPKVNCDPLMPGTSVCLPTTKKVKRRRL